LVWVQQIVFLGDQVQIYEMAGQAMTFSMEQILQPEEEMKLIRLQVDRVLIDLFLLMLEVDSTTTAMPRTQAAPTMSSSLTSRWAKTSSSSTVQPAATTSPPRVE
jgi:hypothetical protein